MKRAICGLVLLLVLLAGCRTVGYGKTTITAFGNTFSYEVDTYKGDVPEDEKGELLLTFDVEGLTSFGTLWEIFFPVAAGEGEAAIPAEDTEPVPE